MNRKDYLNLCQQCAVRKKALLPEALTVRHNGNMYMPKGYLLEFDGSGNPIHTAVLHSLTANSETYAPLEKVEVSRNL